MKNALARAVHTLLNDLEGNPWTCRVVRLDDKGVYINAGLDDKIEKNDVFAVIRLEDAIKDQATGQVLGYKQTEIAKIKITDVLEKSLSLAKSVDVKAQIKEGDIVSAKRVTLEKNTETVEAFTIYFDDTKNGANLIFLWDDIKTSLPITLVEETNSKKK